MTMAAEPPSCDEVLNACDAAVNSQVKLNELKGKIIKVMVDRNDVLNAEIIALKDANAAWYHNPVIIAPAAFILGAILANTLRK